MSAVVIIACSKCGKQYKVPDTTVGSTVRCKGCGGGFVAETAQKSAPTPTVATPAPTPAPNSANSDDDDEMDGKNYGVILEQDVLRCANCAKEMLNAKAIICVYCGFNSRTRTWNRTQKLVHKGLPDYLWWHFPAIASAIVVLLSLITLVVYFWKVGSWADANPNDTLPWILNALFCRIYMTIMVAWITWKLGVYAFNRFVYFPHPPEEEIVEK